MFVVATAALFWYLIHRDKVLLDEINSFYKFVRQVEKKKMKLVQLAKKNQERHAQGLPPEVLVPEKKEEEFGFSDFNDNCLPESEDYGRALLRLINTRKNKKTREDKRFRQVQYVLDRYRKHQQLKILIGLYQILSLLISSMSFPWPTAFENWMNKLAVLIQWDALSLSGAGCVMSLDYFLTWRVYIILPVAVLALLYLFYYLPNRHRLKAASISEREKGEQMKILDLQIVKLMAFFLYLIYPNLAMTVSQMYACQQISDKYYLKADMNLECWPQDETTGHLLMSGEVGRYNAYALIFNLIPLIVYTLGIPAFLWHKLSVYHKANKLSKSEAQYELGFFYLPYLSRFYYFECFDMLHKLYFSSVVQVVASQHQINAGIVGAYMYMCLLLVLSPYPDSRDLGLHLLAQVEILLVLLGEKVFLQINAWQDPLADAAFSVILIALLLSFFVLFMYYVHKKLQRIFCSSKAAEGLEEDEEEEKPTTGFQELANDLTSTETTFKKEAREEEAKARENIDQTQFGYEARTDGIDSTHSNDTNYETNAI